MHSRTSFVAGKTIRIFNHGYCLRYFTYIDNVIDSTVCVMSHPPRQIMNKEGMQVPYSRYKIICSKILKFKHKLVNKINLDCYRK